MQLAVAELGTTVEVVRILVEGAAKKRLEALGFSLGGHITPLADNGGNLIIKVGESRVAVNKGIAMRVLVEKISGVCPQHGLGQCDDGNALHMRGESVDGACLRSDERHSYAC